MSSRKRAEEPKVRFRREQRDTMNRMIAGCFNACNRSILLICSTNRADQKEALCAYLRLVLDPIPGMSQHAQDQLLDEQVDELTKYRQVIYFSHRGSVARMSNGFAAARAAESELYRADRRKEYSPRYKNAQAGRRRRFDPQYA